MSDEIRLMEQWAREAGSWALNIFRDLNAAPPRRKQDNSWVTEVDETIEANLRGYIAAAFPGDAVMGEEGGGVAATEGRVWVIDPIDGTGSFVKRLPVWCVSIGLVIDGVPRAGCVYLPTSDECYLADFSGPALLNGVPIQAMVEEPFHSQSWLAVPSNAHRRYQISFPGKTRSLGSTAANICYVARGSATGAVLGYTNFWDIAGALPVLERAGGQLGTLDGQPIDWATLLRGATSTQPLLACHATIYDELQQQIRIR